MKIMSATLAKSTFGKVVIPLTLTFLATAASAVEPKGHDYPDHSNLLVVRDADGNQRPVKTPQDWAVRRRHILDGMQDVMGPLPDRSALPPLDMQIVEQVELTNVTRKMITFAAEKGDRVSAYLLVPKDSKGKLPAVLCLHQTTSIGKSEPAGVGGIRNLHYALELAERGYVTLAPDYP